MRVRALVVEDEPLARGDLCDLVSQVDWLDLVGAASDGLTAVSLIDELEPDLVFMDIRLPEMSGLEALASSRHSPSVVFTTAYDEYAVSAFERGAIDYLVKPYGRSRFDAALSRVRRRFSAPGSASQRREKQPTTRLFARKAGSIVPVPVGEIRFIKASDDYAEAHTRDEVYLLGTTLKSLARDLDSERFVRVHRSRIVNLDHVSSIEPFDDRRLAVKLKDGTSVLASRAGSSRLRRLVR